MVFIHDLVFNYIEMADEVTESAYIEIKTGD